MNVAFFLIPKCMTATIFADDSLRAGLEKMRYHGYTSIPVLSKDCKYVGTISEGDFLWYLIDEQKEELHKTPIKSVEDTIIQDVLSTDKNQPVRITASMEELLERSLNQSFIPVVDDLGTFIGIVTRKKIIEYYAKNYIEKTKQIQKILSA